MKNYVALVIITGMFVTIGHLFWTNEFQNYQTQGQPTIFMDLDYTFSQLVKNKIDTNRRSFIHFFDSECLVAKVNMPHVARSLLWHPSNELNKVIVYRGGFSIEQVRSKFNIARHVQVIKDPDFSIAKLLGVHSTPQAVIVQKGGILSFKGNYLLNAGLCGPNNILQSAPALALERLEQNLPIPLFPTYQTVSWGCQL